MATVKAEYYRLNGETWDLYYFKTTADIVAETENHKILTKAERTKITDNLTTFNAANKLLKLGTDGKVPTAQIPALGYLPIGGGALTGSSASIGNVYSVGKGDLGIYFETANGFIFIEGDIELDGTSITGLADPVSGTQPATRQWVEQLVAQGTHVVGAVRAASTGVVSPLTGTKTIDGVALVAGDRVLLKNQSTASENGVYIVASGAWAKIANDSDKGSLAFVLEGTTNKGKQFYNKTGTAWEVFFIQDTYYAAVNGGLEIDSTGFGFKIKKEGVTNEMLSDGISPWKINYKHDELGDNQSWDSLEEIFEEGDLEAVLLSVTGIIAKARGTLSMFTNNTQTIAGAYTHANTKNRVAIGSAAPSGTTGYNTGDVYLRTLS